MSSLDFDYDGSIECSRGCFTLPLGDGASNSVFNASILMDNCPGHTDPPEVENNNDGSIDDPPLETDSFNLTAFLEEYRKEGFIKDSEISSDEEDKPNAETELVVGSEEEGSHGTVPNLNEIISEFKTAVEKRDAQIQFLISSLDDMTHEKEEKEKVSTELSQEVEKLEKALRQVTENVEFDRNQFGPSELSSYLNLPENYGHELSKPVTLSQEVQTVPSVTATAENGTQFSLPPTTESSTQVTVNSQVAATQCLVVPTRHAGTGTEVKQCQDACVQEQPKGTDIDVQAEIPDNEMRAKYEFLQKTAGSLRLELESVRKEVGSGIFMAPTITKILNSLAVVQRHTEQELRQLKGAHQEELFAEKQGKEQLRKELEGSRKCLKEKEDELLDLKIRVAQLEYSKKSSEAKLVSFSSRMSPEGSELDVDISLSDSVSQAKSRREVQPIDNHQSEHYEITRTKKEYFCLTPPFNLNDDIEVHQVTTGSTDSSTPVSVVEDLKLQLIDLERKFAANLRYLEQQTGERELERDEFHREAEDYQRKLETIQRDRDRLEEIAHRQKQELEELEEKLKDETDGLQTELDAKTDKFETELKSAIDKIYELREVIRDLEEHIDSSTENVGALKETNEVLRQELERLLTMQEKAEETLNTSQDIYVTANSEFMQCELLVQLQDLGDRLSKKLADLDNFKWSATISRPGSSCSTQMSVSSEDVSVRDSVQAAGDREMTVAEIANGVRRLDVQFDNFIRFEEIIMKKLRDTEIRLAQTLQHEKELELEKLSCQEDLKGQLLKVSDLEIRMDQLRFEPSPNAVTVHGLRGQIKTLTEELEEAQAQIQLRNIELDHSKEKLAASEALRIKGGNFSLRKDSLPKLSITTQTMGVPTRNAIVQTTPLPSLAPTTQTGNGALPSIHFDPDMDLSSITGGPPPLHSTPVEIPRKPKSGNKGSPLLQSLFGAHGGAEGGFSPETLRRMHASAITPEDSDLTLVKSSSSKKRTARRDLVQNNGPQLAPVVEVENIHEILGTEPVAPLQPTQSQKLSLERQTPSTADRSSSDQSSTPLTPSPTQPPVSVTVSVPASPLESTLPLTPEQSLLPVTPPAAAIPFTLSPSTLPPPTAETTSSVTPPRSLSETALPVTPPPSPSKASLPLTPPQSPTKTSLSVTSPRSLSTTALPVTPPPSSETTLTSTPPRSSSTTTSLLTPLSPSKPALPSTPPLSPSKTSLPLTASRSEPPETPSSLDTFVEPDESTSTPASSPDNIPASGSNADADVPPNVDVSPNTTAENGELSTEGSTGDSSLSKTQLEGNVSPPVPGTVATRPAFPCMPQSCEEVALLQEIDKLKTENVILETKLGMYLNSSIQPSGSPVQIPPPPSYDSQRQQLNSNNCSIIPEPCSLQIKPCCAPHSTAHTELLAKLTQLQNEKEELESQLNCGGNSEATKALEEEHKKFEELNRRMEKLKREREEKERDLVHLREVGEARAAQLSQIQTQMGAERKCLEAEVERVKAQLQTETKERRALEDSFDLAKRNLQNHLTRDNSLREENMKLMAELQTLRNLTLAQSAEVQALAQQQTQLQAHHEAHCQSLIQRNQCDGGTEQQNPENLELYWRAKSYRKALTWQKKYLILVIQGYKELLDQSGTGYPQLLRNEIPLTPTSLGLIDPDSLITRFRICGKAVLATVRMKFMVRRWSGRSRRVVGVGHSGDPSSSFNSTTVRDTPRNLGRKVTSAVSLAESRNVSRGNSGPGLSLSSLSVPGVGGVETVLSDYLRRIQSLETEVEGILTKNQPPRSYFIQKPEASSKNH